MTEHTQEPWTEAKQMKDLRAKTFYEPFLIGYALYLFEEKPDGSRMFVVNVELDAVEQSLMATPPVRLSTEAAQELMDSLYAAGLRPSEGKYTAEVIAAMKGHLADMRTIAFDRLKIKEGQSDR